MKAEHRKELQTNALADRLGRFVQNMKSTTQSSSVLVWVIIILVLAGLVGLWLYWRSSSKNARSLTWVTLDNLSARAEGGTLGLTEEIRTEATRKELQGIIDNSSSPKSAAMMARLKLAEINLQPRGLDLLPRFGLTNEALANLKKARDEFDQIAEDSDKGSPWKPQALLNKARALEGLAVEDLKNLKEAGKVYEEVAGEFPDTAAGKEAARRAKEFKDKSQREKLEKFYTELRDQLHVGSEKK